MNPISDAAGPVREVHAIPLWLLREYLEELGGEAHSDTVVVGDGWQVVLTKLPPKEVGSLRVGQVEVVFHGEPAAIQALQKRFYLKTMRAGA